MMVQCYDSQFEIPDFVIDKFIKDFDGLPGSGDRESVLQLRDSVEEVIEAVAEDPEMLYDRGCVADFIQAIAMREALQYHGILHDA
jgi:hypothetical protein